MCSCYFLFILQSFYLCRSLRVSYLESIPLVLTNTHFHGKPTSISKTVFKCFMIGEETVKETDEKHLEFFMIMMFVLILSYIMLVE
jgi:hypothetical protein